MEIGVCFWVVMLICIILGAYTNRATWGLWAMGWIPIFILLGLLGWKVFGAAIKN